MIHEILPVGPLQCNCSVIGDETTREAMVIDPGDDIEEVLALIDKHNLQVKQIVITHAHRIFRVQRNVNHSRTLQIFLMTSHLGKIFVTELDNELDERITENCSIRILSSSAWNEVSEEDKLLQGSFMLQDISNGGALPFVPMRFWPSSGEIRLGPPPTEDFCKRYSGDSGNDSPESALHEGLNYRLALSRP